MKIIDIYTDGSHLDKLNNGRLGCGGVMVERINDGYGKLLDEFGEELLPEYLEKNFGSSKVSNPTAEMIGALMAIQKFQIPEDAKVIIHADYQGVMSFNMGYWRCKEPYIKAVKEATDKEIEAKNLRKRLSFEWVKGHQAKSVMTRDAYWNNYVDLLAKGQKK